MPRPKPNSKHWNEKWDNYTGNNPNRYRANIEEAKAQVH